MRFVNVSHAGLGVVTQVPESRVPHLPKGWRVVKKASDGDPAVDNPPIHVEEAPPPAKRASRARKSTTTKES